MRLHPVSVLSLSLLLACGGGGGGTGPSNQDPPPGPANATVTLTTAGVDQRVVTIPIGGRVNFTNNDSSNHEMSSDPHPVHTDCPPMNQVGVVRPGTTRQSGAFNVARTCSYHDHGNDADTRWQGSIVIQ